MSIPEQITAGDSASWIDTPVGDVTSAAWTLTYTLRGPTGLTLTGVAEGNGWKTSITAEQSAQLVAGLYHWQASAANGSDRTTIGSGEIRIKPNLAFSGTAEAFDGRGQAQRDLDAVRAAMRARIAGGEVQEYSIGNRSLKKIPMADLLALETKLMADAAREKRAERLAQGQNSGRGVFVRFGG